MFNHKLLLCFSITFMSIFTFIFLGAYQLAVQIMIIYDGGVFYPKVPGLTLKQQSSIIWEITILMVYFIERPLVTGS